MNRKHDPVVVITGASAGVGRATARLFAAQGARLALLARGEEGLKATQKEIEGLGCEALSLSVDVADCEQVLDAAERIETRLGPIDIWINNAMVSIFAPFLEIKPKEFERVTRVTYLGAVYGTWTALQHMRPRNQGVIVQVGSALAYRGIPLQSAYCGAKHALKGFTESVRSEILHDKLNIHICMVQLPALNTPQFEWTRNRMPKKSQPVPPIFQPEVAAKAIVWAAHHRRRELYVGGSTVKAVIGNKLIPGLLDRYLSKAGYKAQQLDQERDENQPDNLMSPVDRDLGAHGTFDDRAKSFSLQLWMSTHRFACLILAVLFALVSRKANTWLPLAAEKEPVVPASLRAF